MANVSADNEPREWSFSRIASAAILLILFFGGIAYAVYSFTQGSGSNSSSKQSATNILPSQSTGSGVKPKTQTKSSSTSKTAPSNNATTSKSQAATSNSGASSGTSTAQSATAGTSQLTNTGPGNTAMIGFIVAAVLGTIGHYGWRKARSSQI